MHNKLINEFRLNCINKYLGTEYLITETVYNCKLESKFRKLNSIVLNPNLFTKYYDFSN